MLTSQRDQGRGITPVSRQHSIKVSLGSAALYLSLLAGCSLAPDYQRPDLPVAAAWPNGPAYAAPSKAAAGQANPVVSADAIGWREVFTDPVLQGLIETALTQNRDLRVATLNVAAAEAQYRQQRADLFPNFSLGGTAVAAGIPANNSPVSTVGASSVGTTGTARYYAAGGGIPAYQLDLFGHAQSLSKQAFEQYLGYEETSRGARISLVAEVASAYNTLQADRAQQRLAQQTLDSQTTSFNVVKAAFAEGGANALALRQAETTVQTARASAAQYARLVAQDENALTMLIGQPLPANVAADTAPQTLAILSDIPPGLPSDLLANRPDVIAAEHNLLAANANIGAARAAFFPSISLTAAGGFQSGNLGALFAGAAGGWIFAPQITLPIFTAGRNQAELDLAKVQKNIYIAQYEKTIQTAFREVADGLAARSTYIDQVHAQTALVDSYAHAYILAEERYRGGLDGYLPALDSQRQQFSAQQALITLQQARLASLINLYKALGGGWKQRSSDIN